MFREMRRKAQQLPLEETLRVLENGRTGVLTVNGDEGYPYAVPLNYVWDGQALYFHSACEGHKTDALNRDNRVSFCVVERDTIVPWLFATDYRSAIPVSYTHLDVYKRQIQTLCQIPLVRVYQIPAECSTQNCLPRGLVSSRHGSYTCLLYTSTLYINFT